ncbi:MAG: prepilin-type N-terminal cleavage/methylation domain-containing protein [Planctomycetota bacterium]
MAHQRGRVGSEVRAFTLVELLVVIGIISVLIAIGLTVAPAVLNSGRSQATLATLQRLGTVVPGLTNEAGLRPKDYKDLSLFDGGSEVLLPIVDGRLRGQGFSKLDKAQPSVGRLLRVARERVPGIESTWQQLDQSSLGVTDIGGIDIEVTGEEVLDQWGNPIRFVHPSYDGGFGDWYNFDGQRSNRETLSLPTAAGGTIQQLRRSFRPFDPTAAGSEELIGDADEGVCPSGLPYFYSAGADGDPGTRADNVYGDTLPRFPAETDGQD